jgi:acetoin utilization deacetylase AcuC-like enzyme
VNVPLEVGAVDEDYQTAFSTVILPVLSQFKPDLVILSAGFDAHERDPLAGMRLSTDAFAAMTAELRGVAERHCHGRMAVVTEGGYDLQALAASLDAVTETLNGSPQAARWPRSGVASDRGRAAADAATRALAPFWRF